VRSVQSPARARWNCFTRNFRCSSKISNNSVRVSRRRGESRRMHPHGSCRSQAERCGAKGAGPIGQPVSSTRRQWHSHSDGSPSCYVLALQVRTLGSVAQTLRKISAGLYQLRPALPRVTRTSKNAEVGPRGFGFSDYRGLGVERHGCIQELEGWSFTGRWKEQDERDGRNRRKRWREQKEGSPTERSTTYTAGVYVRCFT
jgi:hypothetical protein